MVFWIQTKKGFSQIFSYIASALHPKVAAFFWSSSPSKILQYFFCRHYLVLSRDQSAGSSRHLAKQQAIAFRETMRRNTLHLLQHRLVPWVTIDPGTFQHWLLSGPETEFKEIWDSFWVHSCRKKLKLSMKF